MSADRQESSAAYPYPSEDYKALLRGEITPEEYVERMKADVDARLMPQDDVPGAGWSE